MYRRTFISTTELSCLAMNRLEKHHLLDVKYYKHISNSVAGGKRMGNGLPYICMTAIQVIQWASRLIFLELCSLYYQHSYLTKPYQKISRNLANIAR